MTLPPIWRKTEQFLAPVRRPTLPPGQYDIYPGHDIGPGKIHPDWASLADRLAQERVIVIDGYAGVFWEELRRWLEDEFTAMGLRTAWLDVSWALRKPAAIEDLVRPFLGGDDPLFGTRFTGRLADFFDESRLARLGPNPDADLTIIYGCGAALAGVDGFLVYVDLPKNEIQFRARAGAVTNLGRTRPDPPKQMYKRFYFVDWPALNSHKARLLPRIDLIIDGQRPDDPLWMTGDDLRAGLRHLAYSSFRVRPWFEPGAWGGHWIQRTIPQLAQNTPNYAWSFELIAPENGLFFESDNLLLEVSFDFLMHQEHRAVLGQGADRFGYEFPIRFDFLDTVEGGNLSLQCHPRPAFIREHFGESFTQDETYYILDCTPDAKVYLGFQEDIDPVAFRTALEASLAEKTSVDVEHFVQVHPAARHDLFLIPSGTIHCSGQGNLVLEISATPYIFTFKMYDWLRLDLDGRPRPLNIERAFANLDFSRKGNRVKEELISRPAVVEKGAGWQVVHLPTHPEHFYDVKRYEFTASVDGHTGASPHVMNLVEGATVILETENGVQRRFNYAETFVVPAAAGAYRLINEGDKPAKVVCAYLKG